MYLRWAERHRFKTEIVDQQEGEQAGIKSATVEIDGRAAYGWMRAERGVHRLVRISPFDSQKRRQTTFALVEVLPEADDDIEIELNWDEIRVDTFRSQGAGGQHVNKTDSAVRLTHLPTSIVAQSQNERSQTQNKEMAIRVLKARLLERALEEQEAEVRKLKGEHVEAGWGNQIRSYVLHPYQMVKDLRTAHETGNTQAVLDGDLDAFMQAELERLATGGGAGRQPRRRPTRSDRRAASAGSTRPPDGTPSGRPRADGPRRPAPRSGATRSTTTSAGSPSRRSPTTSAPILRLYAPPPRDRSGDRSSSRSDGRRTAAGARDRRLRRRSSGASALWFLSMLFVRPEAQGRGPRAGAARAGRCRTRRGDRRRRRATVASGHRDGQRPADLERRSTRSLGIVPRMPLLRLVGLPDARRRFGAAAGRDRGDRRSTRSATARDGLGAVGARRRARRRSIATPRASSRPPDHAFLAPGGPDRLPVPRPDGAARRLRLHARRPAGSARSPSATPRCSAPSSATSSARSGRAARSGCGSRAAAGEAIVPLLRAGFRFDGFPVLLCWDRPFADFARYLPISPGLL